MGFWMVAGLIAVLIAAAIAMAVLRPRDQAPPTAAYDLQVYRDQLRDIDRDLERGVLTDAEATRTRTEIARRVLEADRALQQGGSISGAPATGRAVMMAGLLAVIAGSFALYWVLGAPGYPDLPLDTRVALVEAARAERPDQATAEAEIPFAPQDDTDPQRAALVAELRLAMERNPDEPEGLRLLAQEEARIGNFRAARLAQSRRVTLLGDAATPQDQLDLAEMMFMSAGGYVSPEAELILRDVLFETPGNGAARYYVGLMFAQQGRPDLAYPVWRNLLADSSPNDPWLIPVRRDIEYIAALAGDPIALSDLPQPRAPAVFGPTEADIAAASDLSAEDRQAMIESMVAGLSDRLATDGGPVEDWARLISAYLVLGQRDTARAVYTEALTVFADSDDALALINAAGAALEGTQ